MNKLIQMIRTLDLVEVVLATAAGLCPAFLVFVMLGDLGLHGQWKWYSATVATIVLVVLALLNVAQLKSRARREW